MKELKLGKISTKELADWFDVKYGSFRNVKKEKLEELKLYCDFEEVYGGINVTNIFDKNDVVYKHNTVKNYNIIKSSFDEEWSKNGLDTCNNVAIKIYDKHKNELTIAGSTAYNYVIKVREELYGNPSPLKQHSLGSLGKCSYLWCRKEYDKNSNLVIYTEFTDEEQKIKRNLMKRYFSTDAEKELIVAEMVHRGEITKEEAYDALCEMKNLNAAGFMAFKAELEIALGCQIARATLLEKNNEVNFENQPRMIGNGDKEIRTEAFDF